MRITMSVTAALLCLLSVTSCIKDNADAGMSSKAIRFETCVTRGAALTTSSLESFEVSAFLDDDSSTEFMKEQEVNKNGEIWTYSPVKYWPHQGKVNFWAYTASLPTNPKLNPDFVKVGNEFKATFAYTLPSPMNSVNSTDADNQPDLIFALQSGKTEDDGTVSFAFSHALTAIQFKVGDVPANTVLKKIEFFKVYNSAVCTVTGKTDNTLSFSWELPDDPQRIDYVQTYESPLTLTKDMIIPDESNPTTFMMIPQTLNEYACLLLYVEVGGEAQTRQLSLKDEVWKPNEIHTYTISLN